MPRPTLCLIRQQPWSRLPHLVLTFRVTLLHSAPHPVPFRPSCLARISSSGLSNKDHIPSHPVRDFFPSSLPAPKKKTVRPRVHFAFTLTVRRRWFPRARAVRDSASPYVQPLTTTSSEPTSSLEATAFPGVTALPKRHGRATVSRRG